MVFKLSKTRESEITRRRLGRSISSDSVCKPLFTCSECRHVSENEERYQSHLMEPRHINNYRDLAYKDPKKRQLWLKVWFSKLELAESKNAHIFEVEEVEEDPGGAGGGPGLQDLGLQHGNRQDSGQGLFLGSVPQAPDSFFHAVQVAAAPAPMAAAWTSYSDTHSFRRHTWSSSASSSLSDSC